MKKEYVKFKKGEIENYYHKLPKSERAIVDEFFRYTLISAKERKAKDMKRTILQFRNITETSFNKITLKVLRDYLALLNNSGRTAYTTNGIKVILKRFLRWKYKDWSERFNELEDIRINGDPFNEEKINENALLKKEEIESIMNKEPKLRNKTFFILAYETGCRPHELAKIKWRDIEFNIKKDMSSVQVYSLKTGKSRKVFIKEATFYLKKLRETTTSEFCFPSSENSSKPITANTAWLWVRDMGKHINKKIFPYLMRHSRATELYGEFPAQVVRQMLGHKRDMSELYSHISSKKTREKMETLYYEIEELPKDEREKLEEKIKDMNRKIEEFEEMQKYASVSHRFMQLEMQRRNGKITDEDYKKEMKFLAKIAGTLRESPAYIEKRNNLLKLKSNNEQ